MITSQQEYIAYLHEIRNKNRRSALLLPSNEPVYKIDLNTRTIQTPKFLSVQKDHEAETIYFVVDRYFDNMDLANTTCVIQYINPNNEAYVYSVPYLDVDHEGYEGKILIPWGIKGGATAYPGTLKFAIQFYITETDDVTGKKYYAFNLNTQQAKSEILYGLNVGDVEDETDIDIGTLKDLIQQFQETAKNVGVYWIDL